MHAKKNKVKTGLKANYAAQTIASVLDDDVDRNLDYLLSVNTLTSYLLLLIKKPAEALEFIKISEGIALRLLESTNRDGQSHLKIISENDSVAQAHLNNGKSQITGMLLSNYILSINLLRSIATKFSDP